MDSIIIKTPGKSDSKLLEQIALKMGYEFRKMSSDEIEDLGMLNAMEEADRSDKVSEEEILKQLRRGH